MFNLLLHILELSDSLLVNLLQFAAGRNHAAPVLLGELESTVYEVTINGNQLRVIALLEILPGKVVVLGLWSVGCQYIAQDILLAWQIYEILVQPYCPVARGRNLIILKIQELIGWYVIRQDIVAVSLQHGREDDAVEHDVVLTDEVNETCLWILPPLLPCTPFLWLCIAKLLGVGDVADWSIKPNIENLAFCSLYRNRNTPIQVAGHRTRLQIHIQPALALSVNIGTPLLVTFQDPLLQPVLILAQWEIPVLGRFLDEAMTRVVLIGRVDQLFWREGRTTLLTLVAVCTFCTAARTGTHDVTVGKELAGNLIAELLFYFLFQNALIVKSTEEI